MSEQPKRTQLLLNWNDKEKRPPRTAYRKCGVRRAVAIGLAEYLEDVSSQIAGTKVALKKVVPDWAAPEELGQYPGACVYSSENGSFDPNNFQSYINPLTQLEDLGNQAQGIYLAQTSELEVRLTLQVVCTSPEQRGLVEAMLEDVLVPSDDYYGLGLILPHYHNEMCVYELQSVAYDDDANSARSNYRTMTFELDAQLSTNVLRSYAVTSENTARILSDTFVGVLLPQTQKT